MGGEGLAGSVDESGGRGLKSVGVVRGGIGMQVYMICKVRIGTKRNVSSVSRVEYRSCSGEGI